MNKKTIFFYFLFLLLISVWLITILTVITNYYPNSQLSLPSASLFAGYFGLFYWLIAGASAATSFTLGLDKLGILEDLRKKVFGGVGGYEPEIYVALPEAQPIEYPSKSSGEEEILTIQNNSAAKIAKVNSIIEREKKRKSLKKQKAFYLFGETDFKKCQHKFGFLGKSLKDKPIPDECFGCYRVVECFNKSGKSKKNKKPELSTVL